MLKIVMPQAYQDTKGCHKNDISRDPLMNLTSQGHVTLCDQLRTFKCLSSKGGKMKRVRLSICHAIQLQRVFSVGDKSCKIAYLLEVNAVSKKP